MPVISKPVLLPRITLVKLWEWAGYPTHDVIGVNEYWQTSAADQRLEQEIHADLQRRGLSDGSAPSARLSGTLEVLAKAEAECHGWISERRAGQNGGILVAEYAGHAVRLVCDDETVRIDPIPAGEVAEHAVQALPSVPPAPIDAFTVDEPREGRGDEPYEVHVKKASSRPSEQARLRQLQKGPHTGVHELYVVARANGGERTSESLTVLDVVDSGRVLVTHIVERGEKRLSVMPGTFANLVGEIQGHWQSLVRGLTPART